MALLVKVRAPDLIKWAGQVAKTRDAVRVTAAKSLNTVGKKVLDDMVLQIASQTGLSESAVRGLVRASPATTDRLQFKIDAHAALVEQPAQRPMNQRRMASRPDNFFHADELVNIVTYGDEKVCQICQDLAENGPYKIEEARAHVPAHPNCRCLVAPYRSRRELPVQFRGRGGWQEPSKMTMEKLAAQLRDQLKVDIKAVLR